MGPPAFLSASENIRLLLARGMRRSISEGSSGLDQAFHGATETVFRVEGADGVVYFFFFLMIRGGVPCGVRIAIDEAGVLPLYAHCGCVT